ncbi:MAG: hydantoinase/oxoprolinase family protein [Proteobacteria bacterium]|nr:hydantoinase/oxoprolinase family protein [Pseudomonadota bacterium]MBU1612663.1 hydantoinase/oxoprolinase family protein [Pseudomonadota bacterium]
MTLIGVDTGGTFTDFIVNDDGIFRILKVLSTPANPAFAVLQGLGQLDAGSCPVVHGSTVATNAILERKGVKTALITTVGFTDVIEIGRQQREDLYDLTYRRPRGLVPSSLRFGIPGRISSDGLEIEPFDREEALAVALAVQRSGAKSVAVCLLYSFLYPEHERAMQRVLAEVCPEVAVSLSHEILAEFREFERTSTTVVNAYVSPVMARYLSDLVAAVPASLRIMQSNGGSISAETAMRESVRTILSGPAGGVVGAAEVGRLAGFERLLTFDMGGTSTDVALIDGQLPLTTSTTVASFPVKTPMLDIHTVGAGGGSIAAIDPGGALTVGPESAGADPGPICYGRGKRITVTDANLFLGRLVPDRFLGGNMALDAPRLQPYFESLAATSGLTPVELAEGILQIADSNMERALRVISVERGFDPREFALFSFGGAGGLHCASLARSLGMKRVLVPGNPGILSATGMLLADVIKDSSLTVMLDAAVLTQATLEELFAPLEARGWAEMEGEGRFEQVTVERCLDMRYQGQSFEIMVPLNATASPIETFEELHEKQYGHRNPGRPVQVVNLRLRVAGSADKPRFPVTQTLTDIIPEAAQIASQPAIFDGVEHATAVYDRARLLPGNHIPGPAILTEYSSTIVLPPYAEAEVDRFGNLLLTVTP